jgi:hypothetical protein
MIAYLGWNVMADVVLAVIPITIFYSLKLNIKRKLGLSVLLGLGLVAAVCGAIKTKFLASLNARSDLTWETYNLFVWSSAELFVIIVCGSIPPIKPLYDLVFRKNRPRIGYGYTTSGHNYVQEHSLKSTSSAQPLGSGNRHLVGDLNEERGAMGVGVGVAEKGQNRSKGGGITRVTDITVMHSRIP